MTVDYCCLGCPRLELVSLFISITFKNEVIVFTISVPEGREERGTQQYKWHMNLGRNSILIILILQAQGMCLHCRLHLRALSSASNSSSAHLSVYLLPDVFTCILSFCLLMQDLVIVLLHPLNISPSSKQEDPYSGAGQRTCIILLLSSPLLSFGDWSGDDTHVCTWCRSSPSFSSVCAVAQLSADGRNVLQQTANSSSQKSRWYFWEEDTAGIHGRD